MKKCWVKRIEALETSAKTIYGELYFKEWLEKNAIDPQQNAWTLLKIAPPEMRVECLRYIFNKIKLNY